ncbi:transcriptional regulator, CadC [Ferrimonas balearica DSM 9799]|uniref:Transcriptional regulator, CadC n=1 Tax=Ferrimonas balearica (strain DSM 9799 / CCM 4581 / KCTC 23876 / PAT) TaxID=550540 RepID=E1SQR9_FERBD|nr:winged helix-turn-helix domain-containing protein [Ferrimonas balearica]ADN75867.1 transcriptional regulator, CadC [Ferrimonas balearica DSM 9799]
MVNLSKSLDFDTQAGALIDKRTGESTQLTFSEAAVLSALLEHQDDICSKESLLEAGWPDRVVAASSLLQCISLLRKKLQPYPEIELKTLARRGYQLTIRELDSDASEAEAPVRNWRPLVFVLVFMVAISSLLGWYVGDYHRMLQSSKVWNGSITKSLIIGSARGALQILTREDQDKPRSTSWQRHFTETAVPHQHFNQFKGFGLTSEYGHSVALCPDFHQGHCSGKGLLNITFPANERVTLDLPAFLQQAEEMEERIRYNRIQLPKAPEVIEGELVEQIYQGDIYFPSNGRLLIRTDHALSLVYQDANSGVLSASYCVTDEDCITSPIKYRIEGKFKRYDRTIGSDKVEVFQVEVTRKNLFTPESVSPSALVFYRELRRQSLSKETLYFYRLHNDAETGLWILPYMGNTLAWMPRSELKM